MLASGLRAQSTLSLPIPQKSRLPRERISLTIRLPEKVERIKDPPTVQPRLRSPVFDSYEFNVRKPIPRRQFVFETLRRLDRLGIRPDLASHRLGTSRRIREYRIMGRSIWKYYEKLLDIYRKDALPRFAIEPLDIERFRQVMGIFDQLFRTEFRNPLEADRLLVKMVEQLQAIRGEGTVRLVELKEAGDGSMTLEMEVRKEGLRGWP
jgi:hypothetical protein